MIFIQKSQVVCGPKKPDEKRCEIKGGSQEMAVMVRRSMAKIFYQVNLADLPSQPYRNSQAWKKVCDPKNQLEKDVKPKMVAKNIQWKSKFPP